MTRVLARVLTVLFFGMWRVSMVFSQITNADYDVEPNLLKLHVKLKTKTGEVYVDLDGY